MRILFATGIYPPDAGGPATYTRSLARALLSSGHGVQVVCYGERDEVDQADEFPVQRVERGTNVLVRYWKYMQAVRHRAKDVDVVYLQGPVSEGLPGTIGAWLAGKPTVMKVVGDYAWESYMQKGDASDKELLDEFVLHSHPEVRWIEHIERWTVKRARKIIVPSKYLKMIVEKWGAQSEKIQVIYNAVDVVPPTRYLDQIRTKFGLIDKRVMLTAVRAVPWKNIDFIVSILSDLSPEIIFVVAGDGPSLEFWKQEAIKYGVQDRVRFVGKLPKNELAELYQIADCFVLPSGYEGFAHVIPEAIYYNLPCFISDKGGNPEAKGLFGSLVTVLPYLDKSSWKKALSGNWNQRYHIPGALKEISTTHSLPIDFYFGAIVVITLKVLEEALTNLRSNKIV
jgi:glycosyltransferase involved in cell wall biosynthesis